MQTNKAYLSPELEILFIEEDVVRTSDGEKGELPLQPFGGVSDGSLFG